MFITVDSFFSVSLLCCKLFRRLKDALHSVIKERDCLIDKLKYHIKEAEDLQKLAKLLTEENTSLALDKVCLNQRTANTRVAIRHQQSLDRGHSSP